MGYLVNDSFIIRRTFVIPEADVLLMDNSQPYTLITTNNSFFAIPVFCYLRAANNQTTPYTGFVHIHLTNTGNYATGSLCATYSENANASLTISSSDIASMLVNFQSSPNRFGGRILFKNLEIYWDTLPTAGDGDLIVTLGYIIQSL